MIDAPTQKLLINNNLIYANDQGTKTQTKVLHCVGDNVIGGHWQPARWAWQTWVYSIEMVRPQGYQNIMDARQLERLQKVTNPSAI